MNYNVILLLPKTVLVIEGFSGKRALGCLLKTELCQKAPNFACSFVYVGQTMLEVGPFFWPFSFSTIFKTQDIYLSSCLCNSIAVFNCVGGCGYS